MKHSFTLRTLLVGTSMLAMVATAQAQTAAIPGYEAAVAAAATSDWATAEAKRGGMTLVAQFDSSGPDAWRPAEHPLIYITSESNFNPNPNKTLEGGWAGFQLIDANTKKEVANFVGVTTGKPSDLKRAPHGVDVSPDGAWAYIGWTEADQGVTGGTSYVAVVNMRTLKIDKLLKQESYFRGAPRAQGLHHIQAWRDVDGNDRVVLMFGFGADGGPHSILDPKNDNKVVRAITYEDVQVMGHPYTTPSPDGKTFYTSIGSPEIREAHWSGAGIAKVDLETGEVTNIMGTGNHPIAIVHDADGVFTYVVDGHHSSVYKIDDATNEVVGSTSAGVAGPYGAAFNWDESLLFTVGKGEGSHNIGSVLGVIDLKTFTPARNVTAQMPIFLGGSASSVDHAILHPDPAVNEMWISNMYGWETIVLDLITYQPKAWIPTPHGGDTHSGGFIRYKADF
ncbi:MAG: hypothetical protein U1D06_08940, partial [Paracoccaceae bacterium]|nr:hypothetical protein [Paracoccaceae bacterium]